MNKMMKLAWIAGLLLAMQVSMLAGITRSNKVWAAGNVAFAQHTLSMGGLSMPGINHTLTVKARIMSPSGRTTGWYTKTSLNTANTITVALSLLDDFGDYTFQVISSVYCPKGQFSSNVTQNILYTFGHSSNCLQVIPNTQQIITEKDGTKKFYALYKLAYGCTANCVVDTEGVNGYGARTPLDHGSADPYINIKYTWVYFRPLNKTYCLDAYEEGREHCFSGDCKDYID